jgi:hypothetical protein
VCVCIYIYYIQTFNLQSIDTPLALYIYRTKSDSRESESTEVFIFGKKTRKIFQYSFYLHILELRSVTLTVFPRSP